MASLEVLPMMFTSAQSEAFWGSADMSGGPDACWLWRGSVFQHGYGRRKISGVTWQAHRLAWALRNGSIPDGLWVLHRCDVPLCVNPAHLFLGTVLDNNRDALRKGRAAVGERAPAAKLTAEDVQRIRREYAEGDGGTRTLAARYGVS